MQMTLKLRGVEGLEGALQELIACTSTRTAKATLERGLITAAQPMVERAKAYVAKRSGKTAASIRAGKRPAGRKAFGQALRAGATKEQAVAAQRAAARAARATSPPIVIYVGPTVRESKRARLVEFGTKPHIIRPRKGGRRGRQPVTRLQWPGGYGEAAGGAAEVNHPGIRPSRFLTRAFSDTTQEVVGRIGDAVRSQIAAGVQRARARGLRKGR